MNVFMHQQVRQHLREKLAVVQGLINENIAALANLNLQLQNSRRQKEAQQHQNATRAAQLNLEVQTAAIAAQTAVSVPITVVSNPARPNNMVDCNAANEDEYVREHVKHYPPPPPPFNPFNPNSALAAVATYQTSVQHEVWPQVKKYKEKKLAYDAGLEANRLRDQRIQDTGAAHVRATAALNTHRTTVSAQMLELDTRINHLMGRKNQSTTLIASLLRLEGVLVKILSEKSSNIGVTNAYITSLEELAANQNLPINLELRNTLNLIRDKNQQLFLDSQTKWARFMGGVNSPSVWCATAMLSVLILLSKDIKVNVPNIMAAIALIIFAYIAGNGIKNATENIETELANARGALERVTVAAAMFMERLNNLSEETGEAVRNDLQEMRRTAQATINIADQHAIRGGIFVQNITRIAEAGGERAAQAIENHGQQVGDGVRDVFRGLF